MDRVVFAEVMFDHKRNITGEIPETIQWIKEVAIPKLESMGVRVDIVKAKDDYVSVCSRKFKTPKPNGTVYYGVQNSKPCYANTYLKLEPIKQYYKKIGKEYDIIQYIGIASDEPQRLKRLEGTNKVSLLAKYGYTEAMSMAKCKDYDLVNPCYSMDIRGGVGFALMRISIGIYQYEETFLNIGRLLGICIIRRKAKVLFIVGHWNKSKLKWMRKRLMIDCSINWIYNKIRR